MNATIIRALLEDSRQQVLDNKVFRLLVILTGIPILMTFVIGFYPDRMEILWGFDPILWSDLMKSLGGPGRSTGEMGIEFIQTFQTIVVSFFAGNIGVMFSIAATAFFMPRVLEKGAADTLFSKPVSRLAILLSRYMAGLLFIAGIAFVLVFGMFLGLGLRSGYWDPGFLWGAVTLVYLFGMMHAFSICIAVLTRSSTAAILMTIVLFMFTGAIHGGWVTVEYMHKTDVARVLRASQQADEDGIPIEEEEDDAGAFVSILIDTLYGLHYVLPKTGDADIITNKLRRALTERAPDVVSEDGELTVKGPPLDLVLEDSSVPELEGGGVRWVAESGGDEAAVTVRRYPRPEVERGVGARKRLMPQTGSSRAKEFKKELAERSDLPGPPDSTNEYFGGLRMISVSWSEPRENGTHLRERLVFHFGAWMYEIDFDSREGFDEVPQRAMRRRDRFLSPRNFALGNELSMRQDEWYSHEFSWTAPWRYNIFFSIGSSLAFISAMLLFAWLRLRRIDF